MDKAMNNEFSKEMSAIYGWHISKDQKIIPPKFTLPHFVWKRINWAYSYSDDGLTFAGAYDAVLAIDEDRLKEAFEIGGTWMPTTEEFRQWRDAIGLWNLRQMQIAIAMIYGDEEKQEGGHERD